MPIINFGVIDQPYSFDDGEKAAKAKKGKAKKRKKARSKKTRPVVTTGMVAEILEDKYQVMETFYNFHEKEIISELEEGLTGAIESMLMGSPVVGRAFDTGCSEIEKMFNTFLDSKEMDNKVDGVPTQASLLGISHRFKLKRGPPRPSFIDTGLYQNSFKCWVV